jgi:adenylate kinase family enzyme
MSMQRIIVMGPPGSGKSALARELGWRYNLPVFHLDQAYWQPGWIETPPEVFRDEVERIASLPTWVIDGNYVDTIGPRFRAADTVVYLDVPTWLCMLRIVGRIVLSYGRVRPDAAPGCPERVDFGFLRFAWNWNRMRRARNLALLQDFAGRKIVLRERALRKSGKSGRIVYPCPRA